MVGKEEGAGFWLQPFTIQVPVLPEPPILPQIIKEQTLEPSTKNSFLNILNVYDLRGVIVVVVVIHQLDIRTCTAQNCSESFYCNVSMIL